MHKKFIALICSLIFLLGITGTTISALATTRNQYDDNNDKIAYSPGGWTMYNTVSGSYNQTVHSGYMVGSRVKATFEKCTYIEFYGGKGTDRGIFNVYIDDVYITKIDTYSSTPKVFTLLYKKEGLAMGKHTLTLEIAEDKNVSSTGNWIEVDSFTSDGSLVKDEIVVSDPEEGNQIIDDTQLGYTGAWSKYTQIDPGRSFYKNTAASTQQSGVTFDYTFSCCTGIKWYSTSNEQYGKADVYIDGEFVQTVDTSVKNSPSCAVYDTGALPAGQHSIKIVSKSDGVKYVEVDRIIGVGKNTIGYSVINNTNSTFITSSGVFSNDKSDHSLNKDILSTKQKGADLTITFFGSFARLYGNKTTGKAEVLIDYENVGKVDLSAINNNLIYEAKNLVAGKVHNVTLRLISGEMQFDCAQIEKSESVSQIMSDAAENEIKKIKAGEKSVLDVSEWKTVREKASMPESGVVLNSGVLKKAFDNNIKYIKNCYAKNEYVDMSSIWITDLAGSNQGRMLSGAGNSLRWTKDDDLRNIVNSIIADIKKQKKSNGYCMPYDQSKFELQNGALTDEDKNYDRVMFTKGLLAAGKAGNEDAYELVRGLYDWFNSCEYLDIMLQGSLGVQGSIGGPLVYDSPVGKPEDLYTNMKYYDQDWWMEYLTNEVVESIYRYPLNRPHSYLLTGICAYLDEYKATGDEKYLNAVKGAWNIFYNNYITTGGGICICEGFEYLPKNYSLDTTHGIYENCGHVFWVDLNSRMLELFPEEEKYAAEIERTIYNMLLSSQSADGKIRYFQLYNGNKYVEGAINTCCENMGTGQIASLPQYIYSTADDGIYVNLYAASTINSKANGKTFTLTSETSFPYDNNVALTIACDSDINMKLRIRIPSWANSDVDVLLNGKKIASGNAGTYLTLDRTFNNGDCISFALQMSMKLTEYKGISQIEGEKRYALEYGPILMAAKGTLNADYNQYENQPVVMLPVSADILISKLKSSEDNNLNFNIEGISNYSFVPYFSIQYETFSVFPVLHGTQSTTTEEPVWATATTPIKPQTQPPLQKSANKAIYGATAGGIVLVATALVYYLVRKKKIKFKK